MTQELLPYGVAFEPRTDQVMSEEQGAEVAREVAHRLKLTASEHLTDEQKVHFNNLVQSVSHELITEKDRGLVDSYAVSMVRLKFFDDQLEEYESNGINFLDKEERAAYKTVFDMRVKLQNNITNNILTKLRVLNSNYENRGPASKAVDTIIDSDLGQVEYAELADEIMQEQEEYERSDDDSED